MIVMLMVMVGRNAPPPIFRAKIGIRGVWSPPAAEGVFACDLQPSFLLLADAAAVAVAVPFFSEMRVDGPVYFKRLPFEIDWAVDSHFVVEVRRRTFLFEQHSENYFKIHMLTFFETVLKLFLEIIVIDSVNLFP